MTIMMEIWHRVVHVFYCNGENLQKEDTLVYDEETPSVYMHITIEEAEEEEEEKEAEAEEEEEEGERGSYCRTRAGLLVKVSEAPLTPVSLSSEASLEPSTR